MTPEAQTADLASDCANCAGLCCVGFAFDREQGFGYDKPADHLCRHLDDHARCRIYQNREAEGMRACDSYHCFGAGQYVTQRLFQGAKPLGQPQVMAKMTEAFRVLTHIRSELALLHQARLMPMSEAAARQLQALIDEMDPPEGWQIGQLTPGHAAFLKTQSRAFLVGLRHSFDDVMTVQSKD